MPTKAKKLEYDRRYVEKHRDKVREYQKIWHRKQYKKFREEYLEYGKLWAQTLKGRFKTYRRCAITKGFEFSLTLEEFNQFWGKDCNYCGSQIKTIGLDRVDNEIGYKKENLVACCSVCNYMKRGLPCSIFLEHCKKIINFNLPTE